MFEIIFLVVLAAFAIGGIWAYVVSKKVKELLKPITMYTKKEKTFSLVVEI